MKKTTLILSVITGLLSSTMAMATPSYTANITINTTPATPGGDAPKTSNYISIYALHTNCIKGGAVPANFGQTENSSTVAFNKQASFTLTGPGSQTNC